MITIYRYLLKPETHTSAEIHAGAKILKCDIKSNKVNIWCLVDTSQPPETRNFLLCDSGVELPDPDTLAYIGTVLINRGEWIRHLFEVFE